MASPLDNLSGPRPEVWRILAKPYDIRNLGEYEEGDLNVDERIVTDFCRTVAAQLDNLPPL